MCGDLTATYYSKKAKQFKQNDYAQGSCLNEHKKFDRK